MSTELGYYIKLDGWKYSVGSDNTIMIFPNSVNETIDGQPIFGFKTLIENFIIDSNHDIKLIKSEGWHHKVRLETTEEITLKRNDIGDRYKAKHEFILAGWNKELAKGMIQKNPIVTINNKSDVLRIDNALLVFECPIAIHMNCIKEMMLILAKSEYSFKKKRKK